MPNTYVLRGDIERAIMSYHPIRTSETRIDIDIVPDGRVELKGYVRTNVMRSIASQLAKNVRGVSHVRNLLYSDSELETTVGQIVEMRLGSYIVPMMPIVRLIRGHVFLRGPVPSENAKQIIAETAATIPGVIQVHNFLDVDADAVERLIAPKKRAAKSQGDGDKGEQAMVGGKPVTAADLPAWAMKPKEEWQMAEYKARAKVKMAFKKGDAPDPKEMEAAGAILRAAAQSSGAPEPEASADAPDAALLALDDYEEEEEEVAASGPTMEEVKAQFPEWALKPKEEWGKAEFKGQMQAKRAFKKGEGDDPKEIIEKAQVALEQALAAQKAATAHLDALKEQFPEWALKPKEEWGKADFRGQMKAKRAFKKGEGEDPQAIIEQAQAALKAALQSGKKKKRKPKNSKEAAIAAVREQYPGWAILPRKQWAAKDFEEAADARILELQGKGQATKEIRLAAQEALEAALRGEAVQGGGVAKRRDLTPEEIADVRAKLAGQFPAWALKPKEEWQMAEYKGQMRAKRASKSGDGDPPATIIENAQAALKEALQAAWEALPLEVEGEAPKQKASMEELLEKYPAWALKPKEEWDRADFKAQMKAKRAFKKGDGPDPAALIEEAQAALNG